MQMAGTYSPDNYQLQTSMNVQGEAQKQGGMSMRLRIEAQRVGECPAKQG